MRAYRLLVLPDIHVPHEDKRAIDAVLSYARDEHWDEVIQLGDFLDMEGPSKHARGKARVLEGQRLAEDYRKGRELLDRISEAVTAKNPSCKKVMLEGNHEYRIENFLDENPFYEGMVEVEQGLQLKEKGWQWIRAHRDGELYRVGDLYFMHGRYHNDAHAKKTAMSYGVNIMYGHVHSISSYAAVRMGDNSTARAMSIGCLCTYDQKYLHGAPTSWQHAFAEVWVMPEGRFTVTVPEIADGKFCAPNGKIYG